jgi:hypothetical protein
LRQKLGDLQREHASLNAPITRTISTEKKPVRLEPNRSKPITPVHNSKPVRLDNFSRTSTSDNKSQWVQTPPINSSSQKRPYESMYLEQG